MWELAQSAMKKEEREIMKSQEVAAELIQKLKGNLKVGTLTAQTSLP